MGHFERIRDVAYTRPLKFSVDGQGLDFGYGIRTTQGMLVPVENGVGCFELPCLRPDRRNAGENNNGQLDETHAR
ncbi:MAG TPA: hypothetical protein VGN39_09910 [Terriglobales bacterium]|jgi:hypothetical protein|nr:hypothetical protein [Terriglobales bacterium]